MTDEYEKQRDAEAENEGLPDLDDARPDDEIVLPGDAPGASGDYGTTASEQRGGEPLGRRLSREAGEEPPADESLAARLVEPESGVDELDETSEMVAREDEEDPGPLSPEEQAMHVEETEEETT
jgi:hypothetical protein